MVVDKGTIVCTCAARTTRVLITLDMSRSQSSPNDRGRTYSLYSDANMEKLSNIGLP